MTDRISSFQSSPSTTFYLECDIVETDADYGDSGRWRLRFYIRAVNGPGGSTGSGYFGPGTQLGRRSLGSTWKNIISTSPNPFLPSGYNDGQQRWRGGPIDEWVVANNNGYWNGSATSMNLSMVLDYGSVNVAPSGSIPIPRIARAPGAPGTPAVSSVTATGATISWGAAARGNANISRYEWQIATTSGFSSPIGGTRNAGNALSDTVSGLTGATEYYVRVRAVNGDGTGPWSATRSFTTGASAPTTPTVSAVTTTSVTVAWADSNGSGVDGYDLQYSTSSSFASGATTTLALGDVLSRNVTGLTPGTTYYFRVRARVGGSTSSFSGTRTQPTNPSAPSTPVASDVTTTSVRMTWTAGSNGNAVTGYDLQYSTSSSFASGVTTIPLGNVLTHNVTSLTPGTAYYFRVRASVGSTDSSFSGTRGQSTIPALPPGVAVVASPSGTQAVVTLTPPGGVTGVTRYNIEYQRLPSGAVQTTSTTTTSRTVTGLTPGAQYRWRANAEIGGYTSPWSNWLTVTQPNPNTSPGDYFDGSTAANADLTFSWLGTVNNSSSQATGVLPLGWSFSAGTTGGTAVGQRVTGGRSGAFFARMNVFTSVATAGLSLGMAPASGGIYLAEIVESAPYVGSIYVRPSRAQRLQVQMLWYNAALAVVGTSLGEAQVVSVVADWTRLVAADSAPVGATRVAVRVIDASGDGWSPWLSGEWLDADDVMVSLGELYPWFSGSTPDTAEFNYAWLGTPEASVSARFNQPPQAVDPLADPDCPPLPAPPALPTIEDDCIEETGTWRRYTLEVPASEVRRWSSTLPTLVLQTGSDPERQVRIRYYGNPDDLPLPEAVDAGWEAEQIVTFIPANTRMRLDAVTQAVTASVNGAPDIPADRLLYGTGGVPATWPELRCGVGYVVTLDVPLDAPSGNLGVQAFVTQRM